MRPSIGFLRGAVVACGLLGLGGCVVVGPPPVASAPSIAPGQRFPVFFPANGVGVDAAGAQVAAQASVWARRYPHEAIVVTGYVSPLDRPEAAEYLARHRADAVAAALAANGVAPARIERAMRREAVIGLGETADRRVDIAVGM